MGQAGAAGEEPKPPLGRVAVVGAGVSGLAAAYRLSKEGAQVVVFESSGQVGGKLHTDSSHGFTWDAGANTMTENEPLVGTILDELQLLPKIAIPMQQSKRYVVKDGQTILLPSGPLDLITTPLLSPAAKLRLFGEPFLWKKRQDDVKPEQESVRSFLERHIGKEPVEYIVDPFCAGTFASDTDSLSAKYAFPELFELEHKYGSLFVGALKSQLERARQGRRQKNSTAAMASSSRGGSGGVVATGAGADAVVEAPIKRTKGSFSFVGGMQKLPLALAKQVGMSSIRLASPVVALHCDESHHPRPAWTVTFRTSAATGAADASAAVPAGAVAAGGAAATSEEQRAAGAPDDAKDTMRFDAVILSAPLSNVRDIEISSSMRKWDPQSLPLPTYQPVSLFVTAFPAASVPKPLPGFGVLVPSVESRVHGFSILGSMFSSSMFPERVPPGYHLYTTFVGGRRGNHFLSLPEQKLQQMVLLDLQRLLGVTGPPAFLRRVYWHEAFPEYGPSHMEVLNGISKLESDFPFLHYAGNHRGGLAVGRALLSGYEAGGVVARQLHAHGGHHLFTMA